MTTTATDSQTGTVTITWTGHPEVSAGDTRAIEIIEAETWARRPAALGFGAQFDPAALQGLRGRVRVDITVGAVSDVFEATLSPLRHRGQALVFRREPADRSRILAFQSTKAAADLVRPLIEALRQPDAVARLTLTQLTEPPPPGVLFLVSLPIGNQADLSPRALDVLAGVDLIYAEDTRIAHDALGWRGIRTPLRSCFEHNEKSRAHELAGRLGRGDRLALVTDAGCPSVSDPGYQMVAAALAAGAAVTVVPGPSAAISALSLSGLPTATFRFAGFPPRAEAQRVAFVQALTLAGDSTVLFESPRRLLDLLERLSRVAPERAVAVCRDLTKQSEQVWRGPVREVAAALAAAGEPAGEIAVVVAPAPDQPATTEAEADAGSPGERNRLILALLAEGVPASALARALRGAAGLGRAEAYALVHRLKDEVPTT